MVSAAIGDYRAVPGHKFVQTAKLFDHINAGPEYQMVGIGQNDIGAGFLELLGCNSLYGAGGADRHKGRRLDPSVGCCQHALSRFRAGILMDNLEINHFNKCLQSCGLWSRYY